MKTSQPYLIAGTFLLGALVALVAVNTLRAPTVVQGQSSPASAEDFVPVVIQNNSGDPMIVVFRRHESSLLPEMENPISMTVYNLKGGGSGRGAINLIASRYISADTQLVDYNTDRVDGLDVAKVLEQVLQRRESLDRRAEGDDGRPSRPSRR